MESKFKYQFTQRADADLDDIVGYMTVELSDSKAASDFVDKLQQAIEETRLFPKGGFPVDNEYLPNTEIRKKKVDSYVMYYLPDFEEKTIYILRIVYGKRNMDEILRQLEL